MARIKVHAQAQSLTDTYVAMAAAVQEVYMQEARLSIDHPSTSFARATAFVADSGNLPKTPFDETLKEITGFKGERATARTKRFNCFSRYLSKCKNWSQPQIDQFLASRADHSPPLKRQPPSICDPPWWDFGGFLSVEIPALKADYDRWSGGNKKANSSRSAAGTAALLLPQRGKGGEIMKDKKTEPKGVITPLDEPVPRQKKRNVAYAQSPESETDQQPLAATTGDNGQIDTALDAVAWRFDPPFL
jgi:hypothetical protein